MEIIRISLINLINCPRCNVVNQPNATFCENCKVSFAKAKKGVLGEIVIVLLGLSVLTCCVYSVMFIVGGMSASKSAVQETTVIAFGLAVTVIPYCFARAFEMIVRALNRT